MQIVKHNRNCLWAEIMVRYHLPKQDETADEAGRKYYLTYGQKQRSMHGHLIASPPCTKSIVHCGRCSIRLLFVWMPHLQLVPAYSAYRTSRYHAVVKHGRLQCYDVHAPMHAPHKAGRQDCVLETVRHYCRQRAPKEK